MKIETFKFSFSRHLRSVSLQFQFGQLAGLAALIAFGLFVPLLAAPRIPLVDPDEGLHASIAQEMVESGDWIVPRQLQQPFVDKPILYFWAIAGSLALFGDSEAAVRLPGLLFGALGTVSTTALAWRMLGRRTGLLAGLFYASMVLPLALVQIPTHDVALVPLVNLALLCLWESDRAEGQGARSTERRASRTAVGLPAACSLLPAPCSLLASRWLWTALAGIALGLSVLTKGLAGIAIVGIAYGGCLAAMRRLRAVEFRRAAVILTMAMTIGLSWYVVVERVQPGFLRYYFFERHLLGFFTSSQPHGSAPWWYYFPFLLVGGLPWIAFLPVLLRDVLEGRRGKRDRTGSKKRRLARSQRRDRSSSLELSSRDAYGRRPLLLLGCWFVADTLFLTASHSKLPTYIWPVFPPVAILAAIAWARRIDGLMGDAARRWMDTAVWSTCLIGLIGLPAAFAVAQTALPIHFSMPAWTAAAAAGLTSLLPLWAWLRDRPRLTLGLSAVAVCGQMAILLWLALPQAAETLSARDLATHYNRAGVLPTRIVATDGRIGSIVFYLDPDLRRRLRSEQVASRGTDGRLLHFPSPTRCAGAPAPEHALASRPIPNRFDWTDGGTIR